MMNYIWAGLVVIAVIAGGVTGTMNDVLNNLFDFAQTAVDISLGLIGIMAFFCGLMRVMEKAGRRIIRQTRSWRSILRQISWESVMRQRRSV